MLFIEEQLLKKIIKCNNNKKTYKFVYLEKFKWTFSNLVKIYNKLVNYFNDFPVKF